MYVSLWILIPLCLLSVRPILGFVGIFLLTWTIGIMIWVLEKLNIDLR